MALKRTTAGGAYLTYRDPKVAPYRDTAEQWDAIKDRAVVDRETVRDRMRRGWALEPAIATPKGERRRVAPRIRALVKATPGITAEGLRKAMPDVAKGIIYKHLGRDVDAGRLRTMKVPGHNPSGWGQVLGYELVASKRAGRPPLEEVWVPTPWVHPIRARALGLPVAQRQEVPEMDFGNPFRSVA